MHILKGWVFHVKHEKREFFIEGFSSKIIKSLEVGKPFEVKVESPSIVPFVLSGVKKPILLVCLDDFFDDVYNSLSIPQSSAVGLPFISESVKSQSPIKSYNQAVLERSCVELSSNLKKISLCVADYRCLKLPVVDVVAEKPLLIKEASFDSLLVFLKKHKYLLVDSVSVSGEYSVRGGVVDVFSYGSQFPFRVGFLDNSRESIYFNVSSGNIIKKTEKGVVSPLINKTSLSVLDLNFFKVFALYDGSSLIFSSYLKNIKNPALGGSFKSLSYTDFKKGLFSDLSFSNKLLSEGCSYGDLVCFPSWFSGEYIPTKKEEVPLAGSLVVGDFYVHNLFGICVYGGVVFSDNDKNEKVLLRFSDGKISLDVRFLNVISYYAPSTAGVVLGSLSKTGAWNRKLASASKQAEEFVSPLISAYLKRESSAGKSLYIDREMLSFFISEFPFVDTEDQARAWSSILSDFSSGKPVHRLICGDVGFGKTEIAIRASFVVCLNHKQVVVLAPTTILCKQLYDCFMGRLKSFGVVVAQMSRISKNNNKTALEFINKKIDIIVGTHSVLKNKKILSQSSLFILDEEHRFGVEQKESFLSSSPGCHYISMSATPIPRTLQLSLSGIRNVSTLLSAPKSRKPIITNVYNYNEGLLKQIILNEINRSGQVYFVDNSVNNISFFKSFLKKAFPSFSIVTLFGSLSPAEINKTMFQFKSGKIDILVSTTIIESGIDIPAANTIIINNAHLFGLSQLHQLRGRVGRSSRQAYAYLFVPNFKKITHEGKERLKSIQLHSSLGSGYSLSLKDLEIRGSGSLFGYKQSGKSFVGFEHYSKLLYSAMQKIQNNGSSVFAAEIAIDEAYIPSSFVVVDEERSFYYKSIADIKNLEDLESFYRKTILLFGSLPSVFNSLFKSKKLSLLSEKTPISKIINNSKAFNVFCSISKNLQLDPFLKKVASFFSIYNISYSFSVDVSFLKIEFKYIKDDYYILLEDFIRHLHD